MQVTDADAAKAKVTAERENSRTLDRARAAAVEVLSAAVCRRVDLMHDTCCTTGTVQAAAAWLLPPWLQTCHFIAPTAWLHWQAVRDLLSTKRQLEGEVAAGKQEAAELAAQLQEERRARAELEQTAEAFAANSEELEVAVRDAEAREQAVGRPTPFAYRDQLSAPSQCQ